jgi:hypothetical protein
VLSRYVAQVFSERFEMVPVAPIIIDVTFVFTFYMQCIYAVRSLQFRISIIVIVVLEGLLRRLLRTLE